MLRPRLEAVQPRARLTLEHVRQLRTQRERGEPVVDLDRSLRVSRVTGQRALSWPDVAGGAA